MLRISISKTKLLAIIVSLTFHSAVVAQEPDVLLTTGLIFEDPDRLRSYPLSKVYRNYVPPKRDLTRYTPLPGSQGRMGSCVGWAVAYAARTQHFVWDNKAARSTTQNIASPAALYNSMYGVRTNCKNGSNIGVALNFMQTNGVPSIRDFPLNQANQCQRIMNEGHYNKAERFKIKGWRRVFPRNDEANDKGLMITRIRDQVSQYRPVIISMYIPTGKFGYSSFRYQGVYDNGNYEDSETGHAVTIIGYDDTRRAFKIINSWGRKWGNGGYLWISYRAAQRLFYAAYVMETRPEKRFEPDPKPLPTPDPKPKPELVADTLALAKQVVGKFDCAGIGSYEKDQNKIVVFAGDDSDAQKLKSELKSKLSSFEVMSEIAPWPQCEARLTLESQIASPNGLQLSINDVPEDQSNPVLLEGDPLVIKIKMPDFPSYIYAAYLAQDKDGRHDVVHLIQSTSVLEQHPPNSEIIMGDGRDNTDEFTVEGPNFGKEMILLIASASPLYTEERPWTEIERDYLSGIRDALILKSQSAGERQIAAQFLTVTTKARN